MAKNIIPQKPKSKGRRNLKKITLISVVVIVVLTAGGFAFSRTEPGAKFFDKINVFKGQPADSQQSGEQAVPPPTPYDELTANTQEYIIEGDATAADREFDAYIKKHNLSETERARYLMDRAYMYALGDSPAEYKDRALADVYRAEEIAKSATTAYAVYDIEKMYGNEIQEYLDLYRVRVKEQGGEPGE